MKPIKSALVTLSLVCSQFAFAQSRVSHEVDSIKAEIFALAESFKGQGDQDGAKQAQLEVLVDKLLIANPQLPVKDRLPLLCGAWQQIWGPYEYRKNDRSVDPTLDTNNIFQVIFAGGYYYNVNPSLNKERKPINVVLLRGEFKALKNSDDTLTAQFTNLRRLDGPPPAELKLIDLPALSEARKLKGEKTTLPSPVVRLFFGGGFLQEVYTDHDMRITFGSSRNKKVQNYIYILKRVPTL